MIGYCCKEFIIEANLSVAWHPSTSSLRNIKNTFKCEFPHSVSFRSFPMIDESYSGKLSGFRFS